VYAAHSGERVKVLALPQLPRLYGLTSSRI